MSHRARKRFGQHFLQDQGVIHHIIQAMSPNEEDHVVEIGPGRGALTWDLLPRVGRLDVIELDRDLAAALNRDPRAQHRLQVYSEDALVFDFCHLCQAGRLLRVVGNLPYNISTPLIFHLLAQANCIKDMHFMLQKEVVERMTAAPGTREYGRLSVMVQFYCEPQQLFRIGPGSFQPPPKVDSAMVRLRPYRVPPVAIRDPRLLAQLVTQAFAQRRKTLRNSLRAALSPETMQSLGIDPMRRPETLSLQEFAHLANALARD